ncbi:MAG: serine/threonine protein phosphatase [Piscirickettsiaceae bacterium]|nr:MAG: serine/threonine protein phosphatase [Piscirickettsiaceae bacterium]
MDNVQQLDSWAKDPAQTLVLDVEGEPITLEYVYRHLPKRRLTCRARWGNKLVVVKFFYGVGFADSAAREVKGSLAVQETAVLAPALLKHIDTEQHSVLIMEYLENNQTLGSWLDDGPTDEQFSVVISKVTRVLIALYQQGITVKDPHLDNFLLCGDNVYVIDAGDMIVDTPAANIDVLKVVVLFFAQFFVKWDVLAYNALVDVCKKDGHQIGFTLEEWQEELIKKRRWREKRFITKKVFRNCTKFSVKKDCRRFMAVDKKLCTPDIIQMLERPDQWMASGESLKNGGTATVARVSLNGQEYVLKRYNIKKPFHALVRGLRWSRAAVSWRNAHLLDMLGIPTARAIAVIEERWGPMRRRSYLLTESLNGQHAWDEYRDERVTDGEKDSLSFNISFIMQQLKWARVSHGDMKAQNIICTETGPVLIDLDGLRSNQSKKYFDRQFRKDVYRFVRSWQDDGEKNTFFQQYVNRLLH